MAEITYFVALPFTRGEDGELAPGEAVERQNPTAAVREAERLARLNAGAVAFSRAGDPSTGEFSDAKVIRSFGDVPADMLESAEA